MKEMAKIQGLQLRGRTWYIRVRVPEGLKKAYKTGEIIRSLKTRDYNEACKRIHLERVKIQSEFDEKQHQIKAGKKNPDMLSGYSDYELECLALRWFAEAEKRDKEADLKDNKVITPREKEDVLQELKEEVAQTRNEALGVEREDEVHYGMTTAAPFLKRQDITFSSNSEAFKKLGNLFSKALYESAQRNLRYWQGKTYRPIDPMFATSAGHISPSALGAGLKKKVTLRALLDEYMQNPEKSRGISTQKNYKIIDRMLEEMLGTDTFVHEITRENIKEVRDLLRRMPSNPTKRAPKKTLKEACDLAVEHGWSLMAPATVNMHLDKLKAVLNFAVEEDYLNKSPATGISVKDEVRKKDKRKPFDLEHLKKMFNAPLYTKGADNDDQRTITKRWIPLIALFTGMRLNEICQLELSDITEQDGVDVILIREDGETDEKRVKTEAGTRYIPIHPELKKIGLIDYVFRMKGAGHIRLFPDLTKDGQGYFSGSFSKWFARFLKDIEIKKPKIVFHSFRHNFRDAMRAAKIPHAAELQLGGWASDSVDEDYGSGLPASELVKSLRKVQYKGLDLSHLYLKS